MRQGYKPNHEWACFIDYKKPMPGPTVSSVDGDFHIIQGIADGEDVPVEMVFSGGYCVAYPGGCASDVRVQWEDDIHRQFGPDALI